MEPPRTKPCSIDMGEVEERTQSDVDDAFKPERVLTFFGIGLGVISALLGPFLSPALRRHVLPYIPATDSQLASSIRLAKSGLMKKRKNLDGLGEVIDLGSGDGRVVIAAVEELGMKRGVGVELNPWLVAYSRWRGLGHRRHVEFHRKDLWRVDLGRYDVVFVFGVEEMMRDLGEKIAAEAKPDVVIVSNRFRFPQWQEEEVDGMGRLYFHPLSPRKDTVVSIQPPIHPKAHSNQDEGTT